VIATGTLVYRASVRDVLCVAHAWLEAGGDLIDFSSAGWMEEARDVEWLTVSVIKVFETVSSAN
jgi:hypothetical protein